MDRDERERPRSDEPFAGTVAIQAIAGRVEVTVSLVQS
jgi:hypothetical protein